MEERYLDITKSVMISSPAGSGKTEKLARRYIALLKGGSPVERILAITFTDKAAAEMKERILSILKKEDPDLFERVREKMPRMRISTIHSFCLKLLKRFCLEIGMDITLDTMDSFHADLLWAEAVYESLLEDDGSEEKLFYQVMKKSGIKGWDKLYTHLQSLHDKRTALSLCLGDIKVEGADAPHFENILTVYSQCLSRYTQKKKERHVMDYNDLELLAYEAISKNPEWQNVLYSFDEHTDHILVDEFQDTSTLQWMIIDKLTEEWRSGMGAKRESGLNPTIFLVGDDKQSIYSFRGANAGTFRNVKNKFSAWLGDEYHFIEVKENYRSLPAIVRFVNELFSRIMPEGLYDEWKVPYVPFEATRAGEGAVELILCEDSGHTKEGRKAEAAAVAKHIAELHGNYEVHAAGGKRKCSYGDMAVLLRNRTYLSAFEDVLGKEGIPFIVVKGIGFYKTPEVVILRDLLFFLIDPLDDHSLFNVLRSPLFSLDYTALLHLLTDSARDDAVPMGALYRALSSQEKEGVAESLARWLERAQSTTYAMLIEEVLAETDAWQYFHERQRRVNVKKFIRIVEEFESQGMTGLEIRDKLIRASAQADESKANVNTEGMDAVRIMTAHASKGLQFPMVFLPYLDEGVQPRSNNIVVEEQSGRVTIGYEEDPDARRSMPLFKKYKEKAEDEEKRLFYVSATRAMDYLCMSGTVGKRPTGKLAYLMDAFGITMEQENNCHNLPFTIKKGNTGRKMGTATIFTKNGRCPHFSPELVAIEPVNRDYKPLKSWHNVTEEIDEIRRKHGDDWVVLGRAFHRVFEGLSKGMITGGNLEQKIVEILRKEVLSDDALEVMLNTILKDISLLERSGSLQEIILPRENAYAELPFVLEMGGSVYKGRIDRIIIKEDTAYVYDYKTYPVSGEEMQELAERYLFQMNLYKKAVEKLFTVKAKGHLFFTHEQKIL